MKTDKGRCQDSYASFKNIKPMKEDLLHQGPKLKIVTCKDKTAESHLSKSSQLEQQRLEGPGHSKKQSDSEQHQEMCAASESGEINASTKKGISELGQVTLLGTCWMG
ncbi:uncharacterized protein LOC144372774 isoform X2 [Ictidomys tridecemlineatus]